MTLLLARSWKHAPKTAWDLEGSPGCRVVLGQTRVRNWASAEGRHQTWLEVDIVLDFYKDLWSRWVRQWVFCEENSKPSILRESVGGKQTYRLLCDMGADCWVLGLRWHRKRCVLSLRLRSLKQLICSCTCMCYTDNVKSAQKNIALHWGWLTTNKGTTCRVGRKEKYCTNWQGASSPSRPGWPGSPFSPLIPRNPCL